MYFFKCTQQTYLLESSWNLKSWSLKCENFNGERIEPPWRHSNAELRTFYDRREWNIESSLKFLKDISNWMFINWKLAFNSNSVVYWILRRRTQFLKFNNDSTNFDKMGFGRIIVKFIYRLFIYFAGSVWHLIEAFLCMWI